MKAKEAKSDHLVKVSEARLLSLVVSKLENRVLFPQQIERAGESRLHSRNNYLNYYM